MDSTCRQCRIGGIKLFLKGDRCFEAKCALTRRSYKPGMHGQKRARKVSDYGRQLNEKQKVRRLYGITERQMKNYFEKAGKSKTATGQELLILLESRLDNTLYRGGLASSRAEARQLISHRKVKVNSKTVTFPSYQLKANNVIDGKPTGSENKNENLPWFSVKNNQITFKRQPERSEIPLDIDEQIIVEYYSR